MIVAGIGFNARATTASIAQAVDAAMGAARVGRIDALASADAKTKAKALTRFAEKRGLPVLAVDVAGITTPSQSPRVQALFGTGSLAEAAALVGAGAGARLIALKIISPCGRATAAIAVSKDTI